MSSGIDSTVTAAALLASGHPASNIVPFYMADWAPAAHPPPIRPKRNPYLPEDSPPLTPSKPLDKGYNRVRNICSHLELAEPVYLSFEREYWTYVFEPILESYQQGFTPSPEIACNRQVKFGFPLLYRLSKTLSAGQRWWLATGHYARSAYHEPTGVHHLLRSSDPIKDQTYLLSDLHASVLPRCLFPLGSARLTKIAVRLRAADLRIPGWDPEESEESTNFIEPSGGFHKFLKEFLRPKPGDIVVGPGHPELEAGAVVGRHEGLWRATVGEQAQIELRQGDPNFTGTWYVSRKDREKNRIEIVRGAESWALWFSAMIVGMWNPLGKAGLREEMKGEGLTTQFRIGQKPLKVRAVNMMKDGSVRIEFMQPQRAVVDGQQAVIWNRGGRCLGGGSIVGAVPVLDFEDKIEL